MGHFPAGRGDPVQAGVGGGHLARIAGLADRIDPGLMSEHLAWGAVDHDSLADLLPLPLTGESLDVVCRNVELVQAVLKRRILMENPPTHRQFRHSTIPEPEFLAAPAARTGCGPICDANNIFGSTTIYGWDAAHYLRSMPASGRCCSTPMTGRLRPRCGRCSQRLCGSSPEAAMSSSLELQPTLRAQRAQTALSADCDAADQPG